MLWTAITGWVFAAINFAGWLRAVRLWDRADNELTYLQWQHRRSVIL